MNWTTEKLPESTPRHLIVTRVHPDGRIERRIMPEAEAEERRKRAEEALDYETGELKTTRALREKYGGSLVKPPANGQA
ncbi:MAG: hypothetical protein JNM99_09465 [Verrucomicrobiaceae bacterium]|nr:hypothetical protein [Verrucomicrobiaceae bacterium]